MGGLVKKSRLFHLVPPHDLADLVDLVDLVDIDDLADLVDLVDRVLVSVIRICNFHGVCAKVSASLAYASKVVVSKVCFALRCSASLPKGFQFFSIVWLFVLEVVHHGAV